MLEKIAPQTFESRDPEKILANIREFKEISPRFDERG